MNELLLNEVLKVYLTYDLSQFIDKNRGIVGVTRNSVNGFERIFLDSDIREYRKLLVLLISFTRVYEEALENITVDFFRKEIENPVKLTDPRNSNKGLEIELSDKTKWIGFACEKISGFFGNVSNDFYFMKAKEELVPKYISEEIFLPLSKVIIKCYQEADKKLRVHVIKEFQRILHALEQKDVNIKEITEIVWDLILTISLEYEFK